MELDKPATELFSDLMMEILPPEREDKACAGAMTCLCCRRPRSQSMMDEDGCGICEECLAP